MAQRVRYLTDAELEIMRIIWDSVMPMDSKHIQKALKSRSWSLATLLSALTRLVKKGYMKRDDSGSCIMFSANIPESQYLVQVLANMREVHEILGKKPCEIISGLYENNIFNIDDIKKIKLHMEGIIKEYTEHNK